MVEIEIFRGFEWGCKKLQYTISNKLKSETNKTFHHIFKDNVFGLDISESSIKRTTILLSLLALANAEDRKEFKFNLHCANALSYDWIKNEPLVKANNEIDEFLIDKYRLSL